MLGFPVWKVLTSAKRQRVRTGSGTVDALSEWEFQGVESWQHAEALWASLRVKALGGNAVQVYKSLVQRITPSD